jgi:hypothetical protein
MSDSGRGLLSIGLVAALCCCLVALTARGQDATAAAGSPAVNSASPAAPARPAPATQQRKPALDQRVALMSAELGLDGRQQALLREILSNQRLQIMKLWNDTSIPPASRVGATRVISAQTGDQIRAMLTDAQKAKYNQPRRPHDAAADPNARSVEDWIKATGGN